MNLKLIIKNLLKLIKNVCIKTNEKALIEIKTHTKEENDKSINFSAKAIIIFLAIIGLIDYIIRSILN
jgi:hypothetical protein